MLPVIVVRFFNTVGPRQTGQYGMVIPTFVRQALAERPITVFGDGTQSRSFTYVGDVVEGLLALVDEPHAVGDVFNLGNHGEISILDLAERIRELTASRSPIVKIPHEAACPDACPTSRRCAPWWATNPRWRSTRSLSG